VKLMPKLEKVNLKQKFALFNDHWGPKIVGQIDDYHVKLAKIQGEFIWHKHDDVDELFLVVGGQFTMKLRDAAIVLQEGEMIVIPAGLEHCPVAEEECHIMMIEPVGTLNTGNIEASDKTVHELDHI